MSAKQDALIEKQQNYLDFVLAEQPYRKVMPWDKSNARAELAALCESVTRLKARNDQLEAREIGYNAEIERRDMAMAEQARQLSVYHAALFEIVELGKDSHAAFDGERWREMWKVACTALESWRLSATAPAPQDAQP